MNCLTCTTEGRSTVAVGVCPVCGAGLCAGHRAGERTHHPGGTSIGCSHVGIELSIPDSTRGRTR